MVINRPRGTNDFLPVDTAKWQAVEELLRSMCQSYGFQEIRTPIFEDTDLFCRGVAPLQILSPRRCIPLRITGTLGYLASGKHSLCVPSLSRKQTLWPSATH